MCSSRRNGRMRAAREVRDVDALAAESRPPSARPAASRSSRRSTCRSPTRRRARAARPVASSNETPSTACTSAPPPAMPPPTRKCLTRSRTSRAGAGPFALIRAPGGSTRRSDPGRTSRSSGTCVRESSSARGQRSEKAHIVGSSRSDGTRPGISRSRRRASSPSTGRGIAPSRPIVYGCCGAAYRSATGASSALRPAYMTSTRSAMSATTPRLCVISTIAVPSRSRMSRIRSRIARLDRHVERRRRLVGDQHLRIARERHRDHHALAHAAGELMRVLVQPPLGCRDPHELAAARSCARARCASREAEMLRQHLADLAADLEDRVQRRHRLLEDERDLASSHLRAAVAASSASRSTPSNDRPAADHRRLGQQPHERHARDALPAARLADDPEHLARRRA